MPVAPEPEPEPVLEPEARQAAYDGQGTVAVVLYEYEVSSFLNSWLLCSNYILLWKNDRLRKIMKWTYWKESSLQMLRKLMKGGGRALVREGRRGCSLVSHLSVFFVRDDWVMIQRTMLRLYIKLKLTKKSRWKKSRWKWQPHHLHPLHLRHLRLLRLRLQWVSFIYCECLILLHPL